MNGLRSWRPAPSLVLASLAGRILGSDRMNLRTWQGAGVMAVRMAQPPVPPPESLVEVVEQG